MTQQKNWSKITHSNYNFTIDGEQKGTLNIIRYGKEAEAILNGKRYTIKSKGFLKLFLEVFDEAGQTVLKLTQDSWLASRWDVLYNFKRYRLVLRNFPLAQYVILDNGKEILSYGLKTQKYKPFLHIESETSERDLILDFVLWFLYAPVIQENSNDDFILLATA